MKSTFDQWIGTDLGSVAAIVASAAVAFVAVILYARVLGLRTFSKMSSFDFAMTVATGSLLAATAASSSTTLANGLLGMAVIFLCQYVVARIRVAGHGASLDNQPMLLMLDGQILHDNLEATRVTEADLRAKLREANVLRLEDVRAVVLETTGDVSVLHGETVVEPWLLDGVVRSPQRTD